MKEYGYPEGRGKRLIENSLVAFVIGIFVLTGVQSGLHSYNAVKNEHYIHGYLEEESVLLKTLINVERNRDIVMFYLEPTEANREKAFSRISTFHTELEESILPTIYEDLEARALLKDVETVLLQVNQDIHKEVGPFNVEKFFLLEKKLIALYSATHAVIETRDSGDVRRDHYYTLYSILCMNIAGLGIIVLLLLKLKSLSRLSEEMTDYIHMTDKHLAAIEAAGDGIAIVAKDNMLMYMNDALMEIYDIPHSEVYDYIGKHWKYLFNKDEQREIEDIVIPSVKKYGFWETETSIINKRGERIYAELSIKQLPNGGYIGTARNISERKKAQKEQEDLQKQFYQSQKMEAIGRLAGGIAHDFNNVLASMVGYTEFLLEDLKEKPDQRKYAQKIMNGAQHAQGLVEQMLAFSRRQETAMENVAVDDVLTATMPIVAASMPDNINIEMSIPDFVPEIRGNENQLSQVIINLCINAHDALEGGKGEIGIKVEALARTDIPYFNRPKASSGALPENADAKEGVFIFKKDSHTLVLETGMVHEGNEYVALTVTDNGVGLSENILEHIFEPFFTTKDVGRNTGLGLPTVHGIVLAHSGAMKVETCVGKGTSFTLYFPVMKDVTAEEPDPQIPYDEERKLSVLVVDDQKNVRDMIATLLRREGVHVVMCDSAYCAVDALREQPEAFDLVVSDYAMPKMNGLDLAVEVKNDFPDLPFILLSGFNRLKADQIIKGHDNIKAILHKPIRKEALLRQVMMFAKAQNES